MDQVQQNVTILAKGNRGEKGLRGSQGVKGIKGERGSTGRPVSIDIFYTKYLYFVI